MSTVLRIRVLSDEKQGHVNQSLGLAECLARRVESTVETISLTGSLISNCRKSRDPGKGAPGLLVAAGHATHWPLLLAGRKFRCPKVILMKPSLPMGWFDCVLAPSHDFPSEVSLPKNVVLTKGPLNRLPENLQEKENRGLFLIGGPSKSHGWDASALRVAIEASLQAHPDTDWTAADSRRTPSGFLESLSNLPLEIAFHRKTPPNWLPGQLARAKFAQVTADSASMVYEALTAGARTGLLPAPAKKLDDRVSRGLRDLVEQGYLADSGNPFTQAPPRFHEAARCAELLLSRLRLSPEARLF